MEEMKTMGKPMADIHKWGGVDGKIHCKWSFFWETYSPYWRHNGHILETMVLNPVGIAI